MTRTCVDAGALIAAARGSDLVSAKAMEVLDDPNREFASSDFVRLEVPPKPKYLRKLAEAQFFEAFFDAVSHWAKNTEEIVAQAFLIACESGLSAMDALNVAAAMSVDADEMLTTEKLGKNTHRTTCLKVVTIHPP